jgi:hypothetical protein
MHDNGKRHEGAYTQDTTTYAEADVQKGRLENTGELSLAKIAMGIPHVMLAWLPATPKNAVELLDDLTYGPSYPAVNTFFIFHVLDLLNGTVWHGCGRST